MSAQAQGGGELLASLHSNKANPYGLAVDTIDICPDWLAWNKFKNNYIRNNHIADIYQFETMYDFVISSNCIEHVQEPVSFIRRMQQLARHKAIVMAPWKENPAKLTYGHINIFDESFTDNFPDARLICKRLINWGQFMIPPYEQFIMVLPGKAESQ